MAFPKEVLEEAWLRQGGRCAYCGKELVWESTQQGERGAWHPHHRKAVVDGGTDSLGNCVLLCINLPENCHLNIGHAGNYQESPILYDEDLPYLHFGDR
jgi:hypothetical protein